MNVVSNVLNINLIRIRYVRIPYADKSIVFGEIKLSRKKLNWINLGVLLILLKKFD